MTLSIHGVFINVFNLGVLLTGPSGIGKSELALGLIHRNHKLIADDQVQLEVKAEKLWGQPPAVLQDFLEVRGLGILNIRALFGDHSILHESELQLIIAIDNIKDEDLSETERLSGIHAHRSLLGVNIPEVSLPVASGRNMALLAETAVRDHQLKLSGYNAYDAFIQRHRAQFKQIDN